MCCLLSWVSVSFFSSFLLLWKLPTKTCLCAVCSAKLLQSCLTLCDTVDCSPPGSSVHGVLQARILEWVAMPSFRGTSQPRDWTHVSYISCFGRWVLYHLCHLGSPRKSEDMPDSTLKCSFFRDRLLSWYKSNLKWLSDSMMGRISEHQSPQILAISPQKRKPTLKWTLRNHRMNTIKW